MGHGTVPRPGLKKGVVINIDQTVRSIADVGRARRAAVGLEDRPGLRRRRRPARREPQLARPGRGHRPTTARSRREDVNRAIEVARAVSIPSNRDVLHVERRGFTVDGQEGVKDPLGMSALRLEVETHIVTGVRDRGPEPDRSASPRPASRSTSSSSTRWPRPRRSCPRPRRSSASRSPTSAPGTIDLALFQDGSPFHTRVLPVGGNNVTNDVAIGLKTSLQVAEELKIRHGTCDLRVDRRGRGDQRLGPRRGRRPDGQPARGLPDHRGPDARDLRAAAQRDAARRGRACCRPGSS